MGATERWRYALRCPACGREGTEDESELDGWPYMRAVESGQQFHWIEVSAGFKKVEQTPEGYARVVCTDCGVEAERKEVPRS